MFTQNMFYCDDTRDIHAMFLLASHPWHSSDEFYNISTDFEYSFIAGKV